MFGGREDNVTSHAMSGVSQWEITCLITCVIVTVELIGATEHQGASMAAEKQYLLL